MMALAKVTALDLHKGDSITLHIYGLPEDAKDMHDTVRRILNISVTDDSIEITDMSDNTLPIVFLDNQPQ
jgi:hypothetical protein